MTDTSTNTFGPSALATPANFVTVLRLLLAPFLFAMIIEDGTSWKVFLFWVLLAGTDGIDGWIARRMGATRSGAFLDPLADKVLILGALCSLASIDRFPWLPVVLIGVREIAISLYRVHWGRRGLAVPARASAKAKTLVQAVAVGAAVIPWGDDLPWVADWMLWIGVGLALVSGVQYVLDGSRAATSMEARSG